MSTTRHADTASREHALPLVIDASGWTPDVPDDLAPGDERFVRRAGHAGRTLPESVYTALVDFAEQPHRSGAILLRNLPMGTLPATPPTPTSPTTKDRTSEFTLLTIARMMGHPVGYQPEHGGDVIQNLVPVASSATRQVSTSSAIDLMYHTEAAFHPHRPRYLLLACLRGDAAAVTTLSSIREVLPLLPAATVDVLFQRRFRTAVDESYLHGRRNRLGEPVSVVSGTRDEPTMVFDEDLMVGIDAEADDALRDLGRMVRAHHTGVALESGDVIVVDNTLAVHGRTPFVARYDGTDRWLQRSMVVSDLAASATDRTGRVITTVFGD
ncbi:MAG: TauD/TfdA family dioxygenase [Ilumatobacteraceae bacterium]